MDGSKETFEHQPPSKHLSEDMSERIDETEQNEDDCTHNQEYTGQNDNDNTYKVDDSASKIRRGEEESAQSEHEKKEDLSFSSDEGNPNFYSVFSVFGQENEKYYKEQIVNNTNFHAKIMRIMNEDLEFNRALDLHFFKEFKSQKDGKKPFSFLDAASTFQYRGELIDNTHRLFVDDLQKQEQYIRDLQEIQAVAHERPEAETEEQEDELKAKFLASKKEQEDAHAKKFAPNKKEAEGALNKMFESLPPIPAGLDLAKQSDLLQICNLALLDEIKLAESENREIKSQLAAKNGANMDPSLNLETDPREPFLLDANSYYHHQPLHTYKYEEKGSQAIQQTLTMLEQEEQNFENQMRHIAAAKVSKSAESDPRKENRKNKHRDASKSYERAHEQSSEAAYSQHQQQQHYQHYMAHHPQQQNYRYMPSYVPQFHQQQDPYRQGEDQEGRSEQHQFQQQQQQYPSQQPGYPQDQNYQNQYYYEQQYQQQYQNYYYQQQQQQQQGRFREGSYPYQAYPDSKSDKSYKQAAGGNPLKMKQMGRSNQQIYQQNYYKMTKYQKAKKAIEEKLASGSYQKHEVQDLEGQLQEIQMKIDEMQHIQQKHQMMEQEKKQMGGGLVQRQKSGSFSSNDYA